MPPVLMTWPGKSGDWFFKSSNAQTRLETPGLESRPSVAECHTRCGPEASSHRFGALVPGYRFSSGDYLPSPAHECVRGRPMRSRALSAGSNSSGARSSMRSEIR
jgi:hypothetical protein